MFLYTNAYPRHTRWLNRLGSYLGMRQVDPPLGIMIDLPHLHAPQMINTARQRTIMVKQIPLPFKLRDRVVRRPPQYRLQDSPPIRERAQWAGASRVGDEVRVTRRVGKVVCPVILVHPGCFEEAFCVVICEYGSVCVWVEELEILDTRGVEGEHVFAQTGDTGE